MPGKHKFTFLMISLIVLCLTGVVIFLSPFFMSMQPAADKVAMQKLLGPVEVDVSDLKIGEYRIVEWRYKPVVVLRRGKKDLELLSQLNPQLYDPFSKIDPDPWYISKVYRSIDPEFFVAIPISTYCGCMLEFEKPPSTYAYKLPGGAFHDPCHSGVYDIAGRLLKWSMPGSENKSGCFDGMKNMHIPPYRFISKTRILIGEENGE